MEWYQIALIAVSGVLLIGVVASWILGKDYIAYSNIFSPIVKIIADVVRGISGMRPNSAVLKQLSIILDASITATGQAEEMWKNGALEKSERAAHAENYILNTLKEANIEITDGVMDIIAGAIAFTCMLLPHSKN